MTFVHRAAALLGCVLAAVGFAGWPALCDAAEEAASAPRAVHGAPFVAMVLPVDSADFAGPANAVAEGCRTALQVAGNPLSIELVRTDASPGAIVAAYEWATRRGPAVVVGPMTRDGATALVRTVPPAAPTLMLNTPEIEGALPAGFYSFGLSAEHEARLIARTAFSSGRRVAVVVQARSALARRMSRAFAGEWLGLGGRIPEVRDFSDEASVQSLRQALTDTPAQLVFLAGDSADARAAGPYLPRHIPIYAPSLVYSGRPDPLGNADLEGIRLFEMPWLIQPDHPAVMVHERASSVPDELQKFYALGIDACRLAPLLARHQEAIDLDGVTGEVRMAPGGLLERLPLAAIFRGGSAVPELPR